MNKLHTMETDKIRLIYFSPTKTTKKVVETIADAMNPKTTMRFDLTPFASNANKFEGIKNELAIIGVPVYCGRVPPTAVNRLRKLKVNNCPAIIVVVYGNYNYIDALLELRDIAFELGFRPIAAAAFIGEHSFSKEDIPIAYGRPDINDLNIAAEFGIKIRNKISENNLSDYKINVPGNYPYIPVEEMPSISPDTIVSKCAKCGTCVSVCPTGSIRLNGKIETETSTCILCCACIKNCPQKARLNDNDYARESSDWLIQNCAVRKEPEFYM